jgi:hypothetical protein
MTIRLTSRQGKKTSDAPDDERFVVFNPNSEVTDAGVVNESLPECARPRAQQRASFKPRNISAYDILKMWQRPKSRGCVKTPGGIGS